MALHSPFRVLRLLRAFAFSLECFSVPQFMSVGVLAAAVGAALASGGPAWKVVEQPDLKARLDQAPALRVEELGVPARSVTPYGPTDYVPNPDGKSHDALLWYYKEYSGPTWLYAIDLGSGQVRKQRFPDRHQIHLAGQSLGPDGKYYIVTPDWSKGMDLFVYDPATNRLEERGLIVPNLVGERRDLALGPDGKLYGTGTYLDSHQAGAYQLDPKTGRVRNYGPVGPSHAPHIAFGYSMGVDDTHIYIASGKIPWYLVAIHNETGEEKVLLQAPPGDYPERMWIRQSYPGAWVMVQQGDDAPKQEYWLYHGRAIPKTNDTPPWPAKSPPWAGAPPEPEVFTGQLAPDAGGRATLWYRQPGAAAVAARTPGGEARPEALGWRSIRLEGIETYPLKIHRLTRLPDGRLFGTAAGYLGNFLFDPRTGKATTLGDGGASPYTYLVHEGKLYWSGYPSGPIYVYDPARPWTLGRRASPGQRGPSEKSPASNPRLLGRMFEGTRVKKMFTGAVGSDGRLYFGGEGQRDYGGGGLGWLDPRSGKIGGMWRPFSAYRIKWLIPALDGRVLVASTRTGADELNNNREPDTGRIFVYDVRSGKILRTIEPVAKAEKAGPVIEVAPGRLLGTTEDPANPGGGILYGLDIRTGEVLFRKKLPSALPFPWAHGTGDWDYQQGPDGWIWTFLGRTLVRIDPRDARVEPVGKLETPGRFAFVGNDLYLTGTEQLRRLPNVVPSSAD
jgi:outer membrane protein assembly factor BamB